MQIFPGEIDVIVHPVIWGLGLTELGQKEHHLFIGQAADFFLIITAEDDHRSGEDIQDVTVVIHQGPVQGKPLDLAFLIHRDADPLMGNGELRTAVNQFIDLLRTDKPNLRFSARFQNHCSYHRWLLSPRMGNCDVRASTPPLLHGQLHSV